MYKSIKAELNRIISFDRISVTLLSSSKGRYETFMLTHDYTSTEFQEGSYYPLKGSIVERVLETGKPFIVDDTKLNVLETDSAMLKEGIRSRMSYPLEHKGQIIGTINFGNKEPYQFSPGQFAVLEHVAPQVAIAVENTRLFQKIKKSEEKYRTVIDNSPDIIFEYNNKGVCTFISPAVEKILGYTPSDFYNNAYFCYAICHSDDVDKVRSEMENIFNGTKAVSRNLEYRVITREGELRWLSQVMQAVDNEENHVIGIEGSCRDITERKQIDEIKDNLIRDVTHELRTPIVKLEMSLNMYKEAVKGRLLSEKEQKVYDILVNNVARVKSTVDNILDITAFESGRVRLLKEDVKLYEIAQKAIEDMADLAEKKKLLLFNHVPKELPIVHVDKEKIFHILTNLVHNAIKFTEKGRITVNGRVDGGFVKLSVADTGIGLANQSLEKVFDRFWQKTPSSHGSGIGLAICKYIVQMHKGQIWAESKGKGEGSTFFFTLPLVATED